MIRKLKKIIKKNIQPHFFPSFTFIRKECRMLKDKGSLILGFELEEKNVRC